LPGSTCCTGATWSASCPGFGAGALPEETLRELNLAWHRLPAWPDVPGALAQLRERFLIAPVSNGNIGLMVSLARHNGFCWDAILGAEIAGDFKPKPRVYLAAAEALDLAPGGVHDGGGA
jgi:2-haloacid dehalogenase